MKTHGAYVRLPIPTPEGNFIASYSGKGLAGLAFPASGKKTDAPSGDAKPSPEVARWHAAVTGALKESLSGRVPGELPPLDLSSGTAFQQAVWNALRNISAGETLSYGEVARAIGKPKAVRAVGGACGANPIPVFVPCHRVLAANKRIGGFSADMNWKRTLLAREGVALR